MSRKIRPPAEGTGVNGVRFTTLLPPETAMIRLSKR